MRLIKIERLENGSHHNQTIDHISKIPEGWAVIPDDMETPNFPFGEIETKEIEGVLTVTNWIAGVLPEPEPIPEPEPTTEELLNIILGVAE